MEILYNGIEFNEKWLVADHGKSMLETLPVPYLENPPEIKPIDIGRQLFVDDFLIEKTDMYRVFHQPETRDLPVLFPQTEVELNHGYCPVAAPFDDGLFYDEDAGCFKLWYHAGWFRGIGYAESKDGIHWKRLNEIDSSIMDGVVLPLKTGLSGMELLPGWIEITPIPKKNTRCLYTSENTKKSSRFTRNCHMI